MDVRHLLLISLSLSYAFLNGANDSGTMAASVVSSRCLSPRRAALIAALASLAGALALGSAVARTLGQGLVHLEALSSAGRGFSACVVACAVALAWCLAGWRLKLPGSCTHALLGGWLGALAGLAGWKAVVWHKAAMVLGAVLITPLLSLAAAWIAIRVLLGLGDNLSRSTLPLFRGAEAAAFAGLSFAHGANAAQNSMALMVLGLLLLQGAGIPAQLDVPFGIRAACSGAFSLGVLLGFTRTLKTLGFRIFRVDTLHSFCALSVSGLLLLASTLAGLPLSPGQVNSSSLLGAGAGDKARAVRWDVAMDLLTNWVMTFPACAGLSFLLVKLVN